MIADPVNDHACLGAITVVVAELVAKNDLAIRELADRHGTTRSLVKWLRALPQRDDEGEPCDGPKVDVCSPPQRLRIAPPDPNCVERAALYLAVAELIDPHPNRQLATLDTPTGPHTFPVEDDQPVVLDPKVSRNALRGGLYRNAPAQVRMTPGEALDWIADLALEPASAVPGGRELVEDALGAMKGLILDGHGVTDDDLENVAVVLALAERETRAFGPCGVIVVLTVAEVLGELNERAWRTQRNRGWRIGRFRVRPHPGAAGVARIGGRIGQRVAGTALRAYLASLGVPPTLVDELEAELNREGMTLGLLGRASETGAVESLTEQEVKRRTA